MEWLNAILDILFHLKRSVQILHMYAKWEAPHINIMICQGGVSESVLSISTDFKYLSYFKESSVCRGFDNLLNK